MDKHPERPSEEVQALLIACEVIQGPKGDLHGVLRLIEELRFYVTEAMIEAALKREMQEAALRQRMEEMSALGKRLALEKRLEKRTGGGKQ